MIKVCFILSKLVDHVTSNHLPSVTKILSAFGKIGGGLFSAVYLIIFSSYHVSHLRSLNFWLSDLYV